MSSPPKTTQGTRSRTGIGAGKAIGSNVISLIAEPPWGLAPSAALHGLDERRAGQALLLGESGAKKASSPVFYRSRSGRETPARPAFRRNPEIGEDDHP